VEGGEGEITFRPGHGGGSALKNRREKGFRGQKRGQGRKKGLSSSLIDGEAVFMGTKLNLGESEKWDKGTTFPFSSGGQKEGLRSEKRANGHS